jgi:hypothetical protein
MFLEELDENPEPCENLYKSLEINVNQIKKLKTGGNNKPNVLE